MGLQVPGVLCHLLPCSGLQCLDKSENQQVAFGFAQTYFASYASGADPRQVGSTWGGSQIEISRLGALPSDLCLWVRPPHL